MLSKCWEWDRAAKQCSFARFERTATSLHQYIITTGNMQPVSIKVTALSSKFKREAQFPGKAPEPDLDSAMQSLDRVAEKMHCRGFFTSAPQHA